MHYVQHYGAFDYTLKIDSSQVFTASATVTGLNSHNYTNSRIEDSREGDYTRHTSVRNENFSYHLEAYYQKNWRNSSQLEVAVAGNINNQDYDRVLTRYNNRQCD